MSETQVKRRLKREGGRSTFFNVSMARRRSGKKSSRNLVKDVNLQQCRGLRNDYVIALRNGEANRRLWKRAGVTREHIDGEEIATHQRAS